MIVEDNNPSSILENLLFKNIKALIQQNRSSLQNHSKLVLPVGLQNLQYESFLSCQYQMIAKQSEVLQKIQKHMTKKNKANNEIVYFSGNQCRMDISPIQSSFDNMLNLSPIEDETSKSKFGEELEDSFFSSALNQIQENCSPSAYQSIKNYLRSNKQKQSLALSQKYEKLLQKNSQLEASFIAKSTELAQMQLQLKQAQLKISKFEQDKKKLKLKSDQLSQKQKRICKVQTAMIFKEKIFNQCRKRYQRQKNLFTSIQQRLNILYKKIQSIWQEIITKMEDTENLGCLLPCQTNKEGSVCWKKDIMQKCKQQLLENRSLLQEEHQQMQKEFELMQNLSEQIKRINDQRQISPITDPFDSSLTSLTSFD